MKVIKEIQLFNFDCDALSYDWECESGLDYLKMSAAGISFCNGKQVIYIDLLDNKDYQKLIGFIKSIFEKDILFVAHNQPYDLLCTKKYCDIEPKRIFCTQTAAHLLDETGPKGLKELAQKYLHIDNSEIIEWKEVVEYGLHSNRFYNYALNDSIWCWHLYKIFEKMLANQELEDLFYNIECPFQFCLMDMKINGALIDQNAIKGLRAKLQAIIDKLEIAMYEAGGITSETNLNSPAQLSALLLSLGVKLTEKTKPSRLHPKGQYSTKEVVLKSVKNQHEFIVLLLDYRKAISLMNKFLIPLPEYIQSDGRIRANFMNTVCVTGRLSCSKPPLQCLPK